MNEQIARKSVDELDPGRVAGGSREVHAGPGSGQGTVDRWVVEGWMRL